MQLKPAITARSSVFLRATRMSLVLPAKESNQSPSAATDTEVNAYLEYYETSKQGECEQEK